MVLKERIKNILASYYKLYLLVGVIIMMTSCNDNRDIENPVNAKPLMVSAKISATSISRADMDNDIIIVDKGTYTLSYLNTNNIYNLANVNFGVEGTTPSIGIVSLPSNDDNTELIWDKIGGDSSPVFYLDNVPLNMSDSSDPMTVYFNEKYNPFIAGVFDKENGNNDLLWGSKIEYRNAKTLNFDLHHNMARLQVIVTVDKSNSADETTLDLKGATVSISNLILSPLAYNRADGSLDLEDDPKPLILVSGVEPELNWLSVNDDETNNNITIYTTQDFVIPPQNLKEDINRPRLTITLANGKVYSGVIPYAMTVVDTTYPEPGYPMALSFLKEHILTIRTLVTEDPPELVFMPVYVVEWVDKGEFFLDGHQAGIYSAQEFYNMVRYYNAEEPTRSYQLQRYGTFSEETWNFVLWNSITLEFSEISGRMIPTTDGKPTFKFSFSGFGVQVMSDGISKPVTEAQLFEIVKGTLTWGDISSN